MTIIIARGMTTVDFQSLGRWFSFHILCIFHIEIVDQTDIFSLINSGVGKLDSAMTWLIESQNVKVKLSHSKLLTSTIQILTKCKIPLDVIRRKILTPQNKSNSFSHRFCLVKTKIQKKWKKDGTKAE